MTKKTPIYAVFSISSESKSPRSVKTTIKSSNTMSDSNTNTDDNVYPTTLSEHRPDILNELPEVKAALENGLDPNIHWSEEELVYPRRKTGCVIYCYVDNKDKAWPHFNTPLHRAMYFSDFEAATYLLENGANIDLHNAIGMTPLHEAVWDKDHAAVRFLLEHHADVDAVTVEAQAWNEDNEINLHQVAGQLSIQISFFTKDEVTLGMLVDAGASLKRASRAPWTLLDIALVACNREAVKIFLAQGVQFPLQSATVVASDAEPDDNPGNSRELIAIARGDRMGFDKIIPPSKLYETYRFALSKVQEEMKTSLEGAAVDIRRLVHQYLDTLEEMAGIPQHRRDRSQKTCASCREFQKDSSSSFEFILHDTRGQLNNSADKGCPLCGITADALNEAEKKQKDNDNNDSYEADNSSVLLRKDLPLITACCGKLEAEMRIGNMDELSMPRFVKPNGPDTSTGSSAAMEVARRWLHTCRDGETHHSCRQGRDNPRTPNDLPRRLLHVGDGHNQPKIVENPDIETRYFALSYCRSEKPFLHTITTNLAQNKTEIKLASLPVLIQDAIHVTRQLGYQHLWIDALCIIQDDQEDFTHETARVKEIISSADLTISTLIADNCHTGLFRPRPRRVMHPVPLDFAESSSHLLGKSKAIFPEYTTKKTDSSGPVHTCAWTLQEQLLSPRILWFADGMLHWECAAGNRLEVDPMGDNENTWQRKCDDDLDQWNDIRASTWTVLSEKKDYSQTTTDTGLPPFEIWKILLREYSKRQMKVSDRLAGLNSISQSLASVSGNHFRGGIWQGDRLFESLCWKIDKPLLPPSESSTPSWSWTCANGEISFDLVNRSSRVGVAVIPKFTTSHLDIQEQKSPTGCVSGSITLRGRLCRKPPFHKHFYEEAENSCECLFLPHVLDLHTCVFWDWVSESMEDCYTIDVLAFPRGPEYEGFGYPRWPGGRPPAMVKLIVQRVSGDVFRRVGIAIQPGMSEPGEGDDDDDDEAEEGGEGNDDDEAEEGGEMSPFLWLLNNEEVFEDKEIVLV